jgi:hypothetical protein
VIIKSLFVVSREKTHENKIIKSTIVLKTKKGFE